MIVANNITKIFSNGKGIKNISLTINKGDLIGLIGNNGAGKTTLIKSLLGFYKLNTGNIELEQNLIRQKIAFFPDQNFYSNNLNLLSFCTYSAELSGLKYKLAVKKSKEILEITNLLTYQKLKFKNLSAGMQKKALLASLLVSDPEIIFLDEPTANLDISNRSEFIEILKWLVVKKNKTVVITSHIIDELQTFINRAIFIKDGQKVYDQKVDNTINLKSIFLEFDDLNNKKMITEIERNYSNEN